MTQKTKLSTKGQVVLPKSFRISQHWRPGTEFLVHEHESGILLTPTCGPSSNTWHGLIGCLPYRGRRKTIRQMNEALAREARAAR